MPVSYPGTPSHQALLERVVSHYKDDSRVLAVCLFGSLARGSWDQYSDLDLDVVVEDAARIDVAAELRSLCAAFEPLGDGALLVIPDRDDAGDVVLQSLSELSIRYHKLASTSPDIIDDLMLLAGRIDLDAVKAAGAANRRPVRLVDGHDVDRVLRWAFEVTIALRRRNVWQAVRLLQLMGETLIDIFADSRGHQRAYHALDAVAGDPLSGRLGATLAQIDPVSIRQALVAMLDILDRDLAALSNEQLHITQAQRQVISQVRAVPFDM
jgi:predicted nucleotidyltransferase